MLTSGYGARVTKSTPAPRARWGVCPHSEVGGFDQFGIASKNRTHQCSEEDKRYKTTPVLPTLQEWSIWWFYFCFHVDVSFLFFILYCFLWMTRFFEFNLTIIHHHSIIKQEKVSPAIRAQNLQIQNEKTWSNFPLGIILDLSCVELPLK